MNISTVAVVGGGIAGLTAAAELRQNGYEGTLVLLDSARVPYDRPPLSKEFLAGRASETDIELAQESWYDIQQIQLAVGAAVVGLDRGTGEVRCADGSTLRADAVVLATGGRARRLAVPGGDERYVHTLRTLEDAQFLRTRLAPGRSLTVIGGGLIGAEVAATAREMGMEVTIIEPLDPPLVPAVGEVIARRLHDQHHEHGVRVHTDTVESVSTTSTHAVVVLASGAVIESDVVVVGIGSEPDTALAESAHLEIASGVVVDQSYRTSNPAVYAVGDAARVRTASGSMLRRSEHWEAAQHSARTAVAALLGTPLPAASAPWFWSDRYGARVEGVGCMNGPGTTVIRADASTGAPRLAFQVHDGLLRGAAGIDCGGDIKTARRLIDRAVPVAIGDLEDQAVNLRRLLKSTTSADA